MKKLPNFLPKDLPILVPLSLTYILFLKKNCFYKLALIIKSMNFSNLTKFSCSGYPPPQPQ